MTRESSYQCPCGALVHWTAGAVAGESVNGVRQCRRDAACSDCGSRYQVRVACGLFSPLRILNERWFVFEADGSERPVVLTNTRDARTRVKHPAHV